jgi:hypothetical protein
MPSIHSNSSSPVRVQEITPTRQRHEDSALEELRVTEATLHRFDVSDGDFNNSLSILSAMQLSHHAVEIANNAMEAIYSSDEDSFSDYSEDQLTEFDIRHMDAYQLAETIEDIAKTPTTERPESHLIDACAQQAIKIVNQMRFTEASRCAWSFGALNYTDSKLFQKLFERIPRNINPRDVENLTRIGRAIDFAEVNGWTNCFDKWNEGFKTKLRNTIQQACQVNPNTCSSLQKGVYRTLIGMKIAPPPEMEKVIGWSCCIDIVCDKLAIEVDGPSHEERLDADRFKERLVTGHGYRMKHIPYTTWDGLSEKSQRENYLTGIIWGGKKKIKATHQPAPKTNASYINKNPWALLNNSPEVFEQL